MRHRRFPLAAALALLALAPLAASAQNTPLAASAQTPAQCHALRANAAPLRPTLLAPVASEFTPSSTQLGAPGGVLSQSLDEALSVDSVLMRIQLADCEALARTAPPASVADPNDPAAYKPRTEFDNAPWRFDMSQNGKRMTADEFDAWMKAKGIRVAKGVPTPPPPAAPAATPEPAPAEGNK